MLVCPETMPREPGAACILGGSWLVCWVRLVAETAGLLAFNDAGLGIKTPAIITGYKEAVIYSTCICLLAYGEAVVRFIAAGTIGEEYARVAVIHAVGALLDDKMAQIHFRLCYPFQVGLRAVQ